MSRRILISRPGLAGKQLAQQLQDIGFNAKHGPTLRINALPLVTPQQYYDYMIFISPSAVEASVLLAPEFTNITDTVVAVGPGTARALSEAGIDRALVPDSYNSEGVLAMSELQAVEDKKILLVKGVGGRPLLEDTLRDRGASLDSLDVYKRTSIEIQADIWLWFWHESAGRLLTCASIETLEAFDNQRRADNRAQDVTICVASNRIAEAGRRLGYTNIINVGGAANEHFVTTLKQMTDV